MKISKKKLLSLIKENISEMAMDFDTPDRPDQNIQNKLSQGDTPLRKVPFPKTGQEPNKNFQELLASERYRQVINNLTRYLGQERPIMRGESALRPLTSILGNAHYTVLEAEKDHKRELEQLAIEVVMKEMGIPEGVIEFDARILSLHDPEYNADFNRSSLDDDNPEEVDIDEEDIQNEIDLFNDLKNLNFEQAKRRMINAIIQGASKKGHYMFNLVADRLVQITGNPNITNLYGILMSVNDSFYWQLTNQTLGGLTSSVAGTEEVIRPTEDETEGTLPKVVARGINFPVLVHELIKGVHELFAIQGRPEDADTWEHVESQEDTLEKEIWDQRLGAPIYDRLRSMFPEEILVDESKYEIQNYLLTEIFKLPAKQFLIFMKEVLSQTNLGRQLISKMMSDIQNMLNGEEYDDSIKEILDDKSDETDDEDLDDFLRGLGIEPSQD